MSQKVVFHIITSLAVGGAERSLYNILSSKDFELKHVVFSLSGDGYYATEIKKLSIPVFYPRSCSIFSIYSFLNVLSIFRYFNQLKPDVIDCWMPHSCLLGLLLKICAPRTRLIWNIRGNPTNASLKLTTRIIYFLMSFFTRYPFRIVFNSSEALLGFKTFSKHLNNISIIRNGFIDPFDSSGLGISDSSVSLFNIPQNCFLCINVARYHPVKNHTLCVESFIASAKEHPNLYFAFAGRGVLAHSFPILLEQPIHIRKRFLFLGEITDLSQLYSRANLYVSCSRSEGFPNTLAEAMLFNTPCIAPDVGESSLIVGNTGIIINSPSVHTVTAAISSILALSRSDYLALGRNARKRILDKFSLNNTVRAHYEIYNS